MNEEEKWYRDLLVKLLGWGSVAFVTMAGWLISTEENKFSFQDSGPPFDRSVGLTVISLIVWPAWWWAVLFVHRHCPSAFPRRMISAYCTVVILCVAVVVCLVVHD